MRTLTTLLTILLYFHSVQHAQSFTWAASFGGSDELSSAIAVDGNGNVYTTGYFWGTVDFDPGTGVFNLSSNGNSDIFVQKLDAQGNFVWAGNMGGVADDNGNGIAVDASGNVYVTGMCSQLADLDPGPNSFSVITPGGSYDAFILKLSSAGAFVWGKNMGGSNSDEGFGVYVDAANVYTTGEFQSAADFDPGSGTTTLTSAGGNDVFVQVLTTAGVFVWAKNMGGTGSERGNAISVDASGNVVTTGYFEVIADFDPGIGTASLTSSGLKDVFISKLDASGNFTWAKQVGGTADDIGNAIGCDANGNIYSTGEFSAIADLDPGTGTQNAVSNGLKDIYVLKLDGTGALSWAKNMGSTLDEKGKGISVTTTAVYTAGEFWQTVDFDPGNGTLNLTSAGGVDVFVQKLDLGGNLGWAVNFGGSDNEECTGIKVNATGYSHITGIFSGPADMDPGVGTFSLNSNGTTDNFVVKLGPTMVDAQQVKAPGSMHVFPNPTSGMITLTDVPAGCSIRIVDALGRPVYSCMADTKQELKIDLTHLPRGIYLLQVESEEGFSAERLVIQ